jgi:hypothetical protein
MSAYNSDRKQTAKINPSVQTLRQLCEHSWHHAFQKSFLKATGRRRSLFFSKGILGYEDEGQGGQDYAGPLRSMRPSTAKTLWKKGDADAAPRWWISEKKLHKWANYICFCHEYQKNLETMRNSCTLTRETSKSHTEENSTSM